MKQSLLLAYYGDDFTGSTDALEFLCRAGIKTVLFIAPPTPEQLQAYSDVKAIGVAGTTRAMPPDEMEATLRPVFEQLRGLQPLHVHYKVCSTFDSSPKVGSIGKAIEVGQEIFPNDFVPVLVAAPSLGRYCTFGNLFARMGIGSNGSIYRLDRHPSMSKHPVTPADESDLCKHLARQTKQPIGLLNILMINQGLEHMQATIEDCILKGEKIVMFDALTDEHLASLGHLLHQNARHRKPLFSVGSSGVEMALGKAVSLKKPGFRSWPNPGPVNQMLVLSGSCSPVTSGQIAWAKEEGFQEVVLNARCINDCGFPEETLQKFLAEALHHWSQGSSVIIHTDGDSADSGQKLSSEKLGTALGRLARQLVEQKNIKRIVIAGGDTSSFAARAMGIEAIEMITPLVVGAPLCLARALGSPLHGKEINFKGGQVGPPHYFGILKEGRVY